MLQSGKEELCDTGKGHRDAWRNGCLLSFRYGTGAWRNASWIPGNIVEYSGTRNLRVNSHNSLVGNAVSNRPHRLIQLNALAGRGSGLQREKMKGETVRWPEVGTNKQ